MDICLFKPLSRYVDRTSVSCTTHVRRFVLPMNTPDACDVLPWVNEHLITYRRLSGKHRAGDDQSGAFNTKTAIN